MLGNGLIPRADARLALGLAWSLGVALAVTSAPASAQEVCADQWPAWSPDGETVVFVSTRTGDHEVYRLWLVNGRVEQLTDAPGRDAHPSFSPDGGRIAFQSPRGGEGTHLYTMRSDGTDLRRITDLPGFSGMPVWAPDATRLAFQWRSDAPDAKWTLMVVGVADGNAHAITEGTAHDQVVNWSPDGDRLSFHSDRTGRNQIYIWHDGEVRPVAPSGFEDKSATWSPDGRRIAFISTRNGETGVYIMDADGTRQRRVGELILEHGLPFFSPDGSHLLVTPTGAAGPEIWTVRIEDGVASKLVAACANGNE